MIEKKSDPSCSPINYVNDCIFGDKSMVTPTTFRMKDRELVDVRDKMYSLCCKGGL